MVEVIGKRRVAMPAEVVTSCSLETMYHRYHKNVYNYIAFRINNHHDAEELVSDVFVKAIKGWDSYNHTLPLEGWLIGIAKNVVTDYLRKTMRRQIFPLDSIMGLISAEKQPEEVVVINQESKKLMSAMVKLRDKDGKEVVLGGNLLSATQIEAMEGVTLFEGHFFDETLPMFGSARNDGISHLSILHDGILYGITPNNQNTTSYDLVRMVVSMK